MKLLGRGNTKTMKGEKKGYMTFILHLAPASISGFNVCPMASDGCRAACLNTAGRGRFSKTQHARIRKTLLFFNDRPTFMDMLVEDILAGHRAASRAGMIPVFRLNGTSDIRWENVSVSDWDKDGEVIHPNIMAMFPDIQFYDYSKMSNRRNLPKNYHLTFSRSESNDTEVTEYLKNGGNVAVVFNVKKGNPLPETWNGYNVIDGDETDLRFLDPKNVIVGLRGKGEAKKGAHNGFVVNIQRKG